MRRSGAERFAAEQPEPGDYYVVEVEQAVGRWVRHENLRRTGEAVTELSAKPPPLTHLHGAMRIDWR